MRRLLELYTELHGSPPEDELGDMGPVDPVLLTAIQEKLEEFDGV